MSGSPLPRDLYTAAQVRELDRLAIGREGITGSVLMRRAAAVLLRVIQRQWEGVRHLVVVAGTGNNGGDGYLLAILASAAGIPVSVLEVGDVERLGGDALLARQEALQAGLDCRRCDEASLRDSVSAGTVLVDALLGTGFQGELRPAHAQVIAQINRLQQTGVPVLAVDVPSGLDCDTGVTSTEAVMADITVTFIGLKRGLFTGRGPVCSGDVIFSDLGVPAAIYNESPSLQSIVRRVDIQSVAFLLSPRARDAHKGDCGHVLVVGGDTGFGGAALMTAEAACRGGAGTISLVTRSAHVAPMLARRPEVMVKGIDTLDSVSEASLRTLVESATVVVLGPGLGKSSWSRAMLRAVMQSAGDRIPLVIDADGLNLLAEAQAVLSETAGASGAARRRHRQWVLTPHPGEAARLLGSSTADVQGDRFAAIARLQALWGGVCLLKGLGSLLCYPAMDADPDASMRLEVCTEGNPGMASGGMGDVLSGMIGAFIAQGLSLADSLRLAVCVHGESADLAAAQRGERGLLATDILEYMGGLINSRGHLRPQHSE